MPTAPPEGHMLSDTAASATLNSYTRAASRRVSSCTDRVNTNHNSTNLCVRNHPHNFAVLDDFLKITLDRLLAQIIRPLLRCFSESLLLALVPLIKQQKGHLMRSEEAVP